MRDRAVSPQGHDVDFVPSVQFPWLAVSGLGTVILGNELKLCVLITEPQ